MRKFLISGVFFNCLVNLEIITNSNTEHSISDNDFILNDLILKEL